MSKKPDMYAENKAIMPYGDSVAAPKIELEDTNSWVAKQTVDVNNYLATKFARAWTEGRDGDLLGQDLPCNRPSSFTCITLRPPYNYI